HQPGLSLRHPAISSRPGSTPATGPPGGSPGRRHVAAGEVVVDHAGGLHQGVRGGGPDEPEAAALEFPGHRGGLRRGRWHPRQALRPGARRRGERPQQRGEPVRQRRRGARVLHRRLDLGPVADDAGVRQQPGNVPLLVRRDRRDVEAVERRPERRALAQDRQPRQPGLERLQGQPLVEPVVVAYRPAPLLVVVRLVVRGGDRPGAASQPVGAHHRTGHGRSPASTSRAKRRRAWVRPAFDPGHSAGPATRPSRPPGRWNHSCHTTWVRPALSGVQRITPGPRSTRPVCITWTSYGGSRRITRISSRSAAGPTAVTASIRLPTPPSPSTTRTAVRGIQSPWRSHAVRPAKTAGAGAATMTEAGISRLDAGWLTAGSPLAGGGGGLAVPPAAPGLRVTSAVILVRVVVHRILRI